MTGPRAWNDRDMSRRPLLPVLALALLPVVAGCGTSDPSTVSAPPGGSPAASTAAGGGPTAMASGVPTDSAQQTLSFTVAGGKVSGDTGRVKVKLGTKLRITVLSDVADELHVHVYDLKQELSAGAPASLEFVANTSGVIEVELEHQKITLTHLEVQ